MRVLLVNPAPEHYTRARCAPLGVLSIASYLEVKGSRPEICASAFANFGV